MGDVGLHARMKMPEEKLSVCTARLAGLRQQLLSDAENEIFVQKLIAFRGKSTSALSFLKFLLGLMEKSHIKSAASEAALFLCLVIVLHPDKAPRTAIHERVLTLKRQLQEGTINNWHKLPE